MRDYDVRVALRSALKAQHEGDSNTLIVEEMGLRQGERRVDMAVIIDSSVAN